MRLSELFVEFRAGTDKFAQDLNAAAREVREFEKTIRPTTKTLDDFASVAKGVGVTLTASLTAPIAAVAGLGISFNAMQEQAQVAFTTMLGDGGKAKVFLEDLKNFAAKTPFEFPDLVRATQRLTAMGFEASQVKPIMTAVGNAVSAMGGGADMIDRVTLALSQMQGRGKVATQEMNQLTEAGIPAWKSLAEGFGVSEMKLRSMVEKGVVPAKEALEILTDSMNTKFAGMMDKQAETFNGLISTIKDETRFLAGELTEGLFNALKGPAKTLTDYLHSLRENISGWSDEAKTAAAATAALAAAAGPLILATGLLASAISNIIKVSGQLGAGWVAVKAAIGEVTIGTVALTGAFAALAAAAIYFRKEIAMGLVAAFAEVLMATEEFISGIAQLARDVGLDKFADKLKTAEFNIGTFRIGLEDANTAAMEQNMVLPQTAKQLEALAGAHKDATTATTKHTLAIKSASAARLEEKARLDDIMAAMKEVVEAQERDDKDRLVLIQGAAKEVIAAQDEEERGRLVLIQGAAKEAIAIYDEETRERLELIRGAVAEVEAMYKQQEKEQKEAIDQLVKENKEAEQAYKHLFDEVKRTATGVFTDIFKDGEFNFKKLADSIKGIFKTLAIEILSTMTAQMITPLVAKITGALGGLLGKIPGLGGIFGGAAGAGGGAAAGGIGGGIGGGTAISGHALAAFATNPITLAVAGAIGTALVIKHFAGEGRRTANEFVQGVENPFGTSVRSVIDEFNAAKASGSLTLDEARSAREALSNLVSEFNTAASDFAAKGGNQAKVVEQSRAHFEDIFGPSFTKLFGGIDTAIHDLTAFQKTADTADAAGNAGVHIENNYSPTFNFSNVTPESLRRDTRNVVEPAFLEDLKLNSRGLLDELMRILKQAGMATA